MGEPWAASTARSLNRYLPLKRRWCRGTHTTLPRWRRGFNPRMTLVEDPVWTKAAGCESSACVEILNEGDRVHVRQSAEPLDQLTFTRHEWEAFVAGAKAGEFDL
jgi:uncharacterized protein DUF397